MKNEIISVINELSRFTRNWNQTFQPKELKTLQRVVREVNEILSEVRSIDKMNSEDIDELISEITIAKNLLENKLIRNLEFSSTKGDILNDLENIIDELSEKVNSSDDDEDDFWEESQKLIGNKDMVKKFLKPLMESKEYFEQINNLDKEIIEILKTGNFTLYFTDKKNATLINKRVSDQVALLLSNDPSGLDEEELKKYKQNKKGKEVYLLSNLSDNGVGYSDYIHKILVLALRGKIESI